MENKVYNSANLAGKAILVKANNYIAGIKVQKDYTIATNGYLLVKVSANMERENFPVNELVNENQPETCFLDSEDITVIENSLKIGKTMKRMPMLSYFSIDQTENKENLAVTTFNSKLKPTINMFENSHVNYPEVQTLFEKVVGFGKNVSFTLEMLENIVKVLKEANVEKDASVQFNFTDDEKMFSKDMVHATTKNKTDQQIDLLIMPTNKS
jgi:hypothetical protein